MKVKAVKPTAKDALRIRMENAYDKLNKLAAEKIPEGRSKIVYEIIAFDLGISGQTVANYVNKKSANANGFMIEAIAEQIEKIKL